jgi:hypothetical protein
MAKFTVWYKKEGAGREEGVNARNLFSTHVALGEFAAKDLEDLYCKMQGENWSSGENQAKAQALIASKGTHHTSMSCGDVAVDEEGILWVCAFAGWSILPL